jgi:hypothetical protein
MRHKALFPLVIAGAVLAGACTGLSRPAVPTLLPAAAVQPTPTLRPDGLPAFEIWAHDDSYTAPEVVPEGRVGVTLHVDGHEQRNAQFFRVKDNVSLAQVGAAFQQRPRSAVELLDFAGGPGTVPPGGSQDVIQDLSEGQYIMATLLLGQDGQQYVPTGMFKSFRVVAPTQAPAAAPPLPGDQQIVLSDFAFGIPHLRSGPRSLQLRNAGSQPHEILVKRLENGHDVQDALKFVISPVGTPPYSDAGGVLVFPGGETTSFSLDLSPGPYVAICYFRDPASGKTHAELGMIRDFIVD